MADVKIAGNTVAMLREAWPEELANRLNSDIWVAYVDCLCDMESYDDELKLADLMAKLGDGF